MPESEVAALRRKFGVTVQGTNIPNPVTTFEEGSFPGAPMLCSRINVCTDVQAQHNPAAQRKRAYSHGHMHTRPVQRMHGTPDASSDRQMRQSHTFHQLSARASEGSCLRASDPAAQGMR
jgi:hypothetical protein